MWGDEKSRRIGRAVCRLLRDRDATDVVSLTLEAENTGDNVVYRIRLCSGALSGHIELDRFSTTQSVATLHINETAYSISHLSQAQADRLVDLLGVVEQECRNSLKSVQWQDPRMDKTYACKKDGRYRIQPRAPICN